MTHLEDQVVLVTGCSAGIGLGNGATLVTALGRLPRPVLDRMMGRRFGFYELGRPSP